MRRLNRNLGFILLAIYLILVGLAGLGVVSLGIIIPLCALAAGILLLIDR